MNTITSYKLNQYNVHFEVPFAYLSKDFVDVSVRGEAGVKKLRLLTDFRFLDHNTIETTRPFGSIGYSLIEIRRNTPAERKLVNFTDGSILTADELNASTTQALHVAEEGRDLTGYSLELTPKGQLDAKGRNIINVADPIEPTDAVNLKVISEASDSIIASRDSALASKNTAEQAAQNALNSERIATAKAEEAKASAKTSSSDAASAKASQVASKQSETKAKESETKAKMSEVEAANSAKQATQAVKSCRPSFDTVEKLKQYEGSVGQVVEVLGYYTSKDGATHFRILSRDDDGSGILLLNGLWANIIDYDYYHSSWFGASKSGNVAPIFVKMIAYGKPLLIDKYVYQLDTPVIDAEGFIVLDEGEYSKYNIVRGEYLPEATPKRTLLGLFNYSAHAPSDTGHQAMAYNPTTEEYILSFNSTSSSQSTIIIIDRKFKYVRKATLDLGHANALSFNVKDQKLIVAGYDTGSSSDTQNKSITIVDYKTLKIERTFVTAIYASKVEYNNKNSCYVVSNSDEVCIYDKTFNLIKQYRLTPIDPSYLISQDGTFFRGYQMNVFWIKYTTENVINVYDLKGDLVREYKFTSLKTTSEPEGLTILDDSRLLTSEYIYADKTVYIYEMDFDGVDVSYDEVSTPILKRIYVDTNSVTVGNGTNKYPYNNLKLALEANIGVHALEIIFKGKHTGSLEITNKTNLIISRNGDATATIEGNLTFLGCTRVTMSNLTISNTSSGDLVSLRNVTGATFTSCVFTTTASPQNGKAIVSYGSKAKAVSCTFNKFESVCYVTDAGECLFDKCTSTSCQFAIKAQYGVAYVNNCTFTGSDKLYNGMGAIYRNPRLFSVEALNTPYHVDNLKERGLYQEFKELMQEHITYNKVSTLLLLNEEDAVGDSPVVYTEPSSELFNYFVGNVI